MAVLATLGIAAIAVIIAFYVLLVIATWMIFQKAGEGGWKSLIPIYNLYILFKITWNKKMFWIYLLLGILASALSASKETLPLILAALSGTGVLIISIIDMIKLSKAFGHGAGFTIGLLLLPNIFTMILGLGSDKYIGPQ